MYEIKTRPRLLARQSEIGDIDESRHKEVNAPELIIAEPVLGGIIKCGLDHKTTTTTAKK